MVHPAEKDMLGDVPQKKLGIGYAGTPGKGPTGETCGTCTYCRANGHSRKFWKCRHERGYVSFSEASDIRRKTPACEFWERE